MSTNGRVYRSKHSRRRSEERRAANAEGGTVFVGRNPLNFGKPPPSEFIGTNPLLLKRDKHERETQSSVGRSPSRNEDNKSSRSTSEEIASTSNLSVTPDVLPVLYYEREEDEVEEDELILEEEDTPDGSEVEDSEDIPIRLLTDFVIYDLSDNMRLVRFDALLGSAQHQQYGASGEVTPCIISNESDDETVVSQEVKSRRVSLTKIKEVNVHWVNEERRNINLDPDIYLRTEFAWYTLKVPNDGYVDFYSPFWIKHFVFHQLMSSALTNRKLSYASFITEIEDAEEPEEIVHTTIDKAQIGSPAMHAYVLSNYQDLCEDAGTGKLIRSLATVPAVQEMLKPRKTRWGKEKATTTKRHLQNKRRPHPTVVTHRLHALCKDLFPLNDFMVVGSRSHSSKPPAQNVKRFPVHRRNPDTIIFPKADQTVPYHYRAVIVDGVRYEVGDTVIVQGGEDDNKKRAAATMKGTKGEKQWYAKLNYFFEIGGQSQVHVQWYQHGSQILLQEVAHQNMLYLIDECDDINLGAICQKVEVHTLAPTEDEPSHVSDEEVFYTGLYWDQDSSAFLQRPEDAIEAALDSCRTGRKCLSCGVKRLNKRNKKWTCQSSESLVQGETEYHPRDFVYLRPSLKETDVYAIGQIISIHKAVAKDKDPTIDVQVYQRYDLIARSENKTKFGNLVYNEKRLFRTNEMMDNISADLIEGKAYVIHAQSVAVDDLEEWQSHDDHFFADRSANSARPRSVAELKPLHPVAFQNCRPCHQARRQHLADDRALQNSHEPLRGLELFAGAGGLSTGLDQSGFVKTRWAVELEPSAALSYMANHPHTTVYNGDVNKLLKHAIETHEGKRPERLRTTLGKDIPLMPKPGEVEFIYGGPPCQGFSGMNHNKKVDDPRNTLACNMLSFVDFYRPKYFLLENVDALLYAKVGAEQDGGRHVGGVKKGMVKLIMRALISMGYQAHFKVLQAGQYGSPQSRLRVIFLGAKRTLPLPDFPIPTHCTPDDVDKYNLPTGTRLWPVVRVNPDSDHPHDWLQFAPLLPATIEDAISDLPPFDWINPHLLVASTEADDYEDIERLQAGVLRFSAIIDKTSRRLYAGFLEGVPYLSPKSRYQKWMRAGMQPNDELSYHYTAKYNAKTVERTCSVPLKRDANHADLSGPLSMGPKFLTPGGGSKAKYKTIFGRLDAKGPFNTALTTAQPNAKGGRLLHPTQRRVVTVREFARAQGFPDHHKFLSLGHAASDDQYKQIGNAVPVPLALALGKAIGQVLLQIWRKEEAEAVDAREDSPEVPMDIDS